MSKSILIAFLCLVIIMGFTLIRIYNFMPVVQTCQDEFALIDKCGCVPCNSGLISLFHVEKTCETYLTALNLLNSTKP